MPVGNHNLKMWAHYGCQPAQHLTLPARISGIWYEEDPIPCNADTEVTSYFTRINGIWYEEDPIPCNGDAVVIVHVARTSGI